MDATVVMERKINMDVFRTYVPYAPYVFKGGKHQGQNLESLMFKNYGWVAYLWEQINKENCVSPNELHRHLAWLMSASENRETVISCPFCGRKAKYFSASYLSSRLVCCEDINCRNNLKSRLGNVPLLPFKFSSLQYFSKIGKVAYDKAQGFFKTAFGLPANLSPEKILEFFQA